MNYAIRVERVTPRPPAVVRLRAGPSELPAVIPAACGQVWSVMRALNVKDAGRHVSLYLDDEINLEVGVELDTPFASHGDVVGSNLPTGMVATTTHFGPYPLLHRAHDAIRQWCPAHGQSLAGTRWEIYDHWNNEWNADPSRIRTDVFHLLKTPE